MKKSRKKKVVTGLEDLPQAQDIAQETLPVVDAGIENAECEEKKKNAITRKKRILRGLMVLGVVLVMTGGMFSIFFFGFGMNPFSSEAPDLGVEGVVALVFIFVAIYILQALTLNLIPGTTTFFITVLAASLFSVFVANDAGDLEIVWRNLVMTYVVSIVAVLFASIALYCVGKFGGRRLLYWLFDKEAIEKYLDWFSRNGSKGVPWLFLIPFFPTDLLCLVCGAAKMKFWQFILIVIVFRPIEVALLILWRLIGQTIIDNASVIEMILFVNMMILNVAFLVIYHRALLNIFNRVFNRRRYLKDQELAAQVAAEEALKSYRLAKAAEERELLQVQQKKS